jgi:hypothetical protein
MVSKLTAMLDLETKEYKAGQKRRLTQKYELKLGSWRRIRHKDGVFAARK